VDGASSILKFKTGPYMNTSNPSNKDGYRSIVLKKVLREPEEIIAILIIVYRKSPNCFIAKMTICELKVMDFIAITLFDKTYYISEIGIE
jgi:hypothetical protein